MVDEASRVRILDAAEVFVRPTRVRRDAHLGRGRRRGRAEGPESVVLRTIVWREVVSHPDVQQALLRIHRGLVALTVDVITAAAPLQLAAPRRRTAAQTWVSTMLLAANLLRFTGRVIDLAAPARLLEDGLLAT